MTFLPVLPGVSIRLIQRIVCQRFGLELDVMASPSRKHDAAHPRQIAMRLAREFTAKSLPNIGRHFGGRDHTTVIHAIRAVEIRNQRSESARAAYLELKAALEMIAPKPPGETMSDLYAELGIERDATPEKIKAAHRSKVREHHPDRGGDTARFQAIQLAYDTLKDGDKRRRYDETGETAGADKGDVATQMLAMLISSLVDQMLQEGVPIETSDMREMIAQGIKGKLRELKSQRSGIERSIARAANLGKRWKRKRRAKGPDLIGDTIRRRERDLEDALKRLGEAEDAWIRAEKMLGDYSYQFEPRSSATTSTWNNIQFTRIDFGA